MAFPFYKNLQEASGSITGGNFGLWYNKFIPISNFDACKASDEKGNKDNAVRYYHDKYNKIRKDTINKLLDKKHFDQANFCNALSFKYETVILKAKLKSPLITGIGETHPHEISMVFDHNLGIPYIPASGIKGIVRFAHTLSLLFDKDGNFTDKYIEEEKGKEVIKENNEKTSIPQLFGTQEKRGRVIFLDVYPEKMPDLHIDIMNPHYGDYYSDDKHKTPPGDYLNPVPIKFLTVAKDTVFMFRALVDKDGAGLPEKVKGALRKALTEEGVGAKTAVGYGLFDQLKEEESDSVIESIKKKEEKKASDAEEAIAKAEAERLKNMTEEEIMKEKIAKLQNEMIEEIAKLQNDSNQISLLVKRCMSSNFKNFVYKGLKEKLEELGQWKPGGSKQRKIKMQKRNTEIESKINM